MRASGVRMYVLRQSRMLATARFSSEFGRDGSKQLLVTSLENFQHPPKHHRRPQLHTPTNATPPPPSPYFQRSHVPSPIPRDPLRRPHPPYYHVHYIVVHTVCLIVPFILNRHGYYHFDPRGMLANVSDIFRLRHRVCIRAAGVPRTNILQYWYRATVRRGLVAMFDSSMMPFNCILNGGRHPRLYKLAHPTFAQIFTYQLTTPPRF